MGEPHRNTGGMPSAGRACCLYIAGGKPFAFALVPWFTGIVVAGANLLESKLAHKEVPPLKILMVEDERRFSEAVAHVLQKNHYLVDLAFDG